MLKMMRQFTLVVHACLFTSFHYISGIGMTMASLFYGLRSGMGSRSTEMLGFRTKFQGLTIVAIVGGFQVASWRKQNREKLKEIEALKAGKLV